jgi:hypothetical protein
MVVNALSEHTIWSTADEEAQLPYLPHFMLYMPEKTLCPSTHGRMLFPACFRAENVGCVDRSRRFTAGMTAAVRDDGLLLEERAHAGAFAGGSHGSPGWRSGSRTPAFCGFGITS